MAMRPLKRRVLAAGAIVAATLASNPEVRSVRLQPDGDRFAMSLRVVAAQSPSTVAMLVQDASIKSALDNARTSEPQTLADQIRFCEVPAPPFNEAARAQVLRAAFASLGLERVRIDAAGNVLGERRGTAPRPHLVVAAHLDTVFPPETDVHVTREGAMLRGPGISDNCRGLAVLVAIARALNAGRVRTPGSVTFVANVGEEGLGDLRGVKALFSRPPAAIDRFVSIDGGGLNITHVAVGSHRYRVTFKGPGGHSYGAFGLANPAGALGRAIARISELRVPAQPKTTFTIGRVGGGTSVNSIPFEAWMEVDMRSPSAAALAALDEQFQAAVAEAVAEENMRWARPGMITAVNELVGDRPAGTTPESSPIVLTAQAVARALGLSVALGEGSTDANLPISVNIPAITIGGGGRGANGHALTESFDSTDSWEGTQNAVLLTIALARE
jgi:acetylornithine deacetylase/succinyl-diaminopimelate desuccinylase-like protein